MSGRELASRGENGAAQATDALAQATSDVERARARVESSILALRREVVRRTDWRRWVRGQPLGFVAGALALGFLLGFRRR